MILTIIRHAQSTNNALPDERHRIVEPPLTEIGREQAALLARHLADGHLTDPFLNGKDRPLFDRLYCSPMLRALQTARPVSAALGLRPDVWTDIHECGGMWLDHGEQAGIVGYPGMTHGEMAAAYPDYRLPEAVGADGWWNRDMELPDQCGERAERVAEALRSWPRPDERIAIVTHGGFTNRLLGALLRPAATVWMHVYNTSVSVVEFYPDGGLGVRFTNRTDHLPPEKVT
jgi:probable phosphoglycerate mutase